VKTAEFVCECTRRDYPFTILYASMIDVMTWLSLTGIPGIINGGLRLRRLLISK